MIHRGGTPLERRAVCKGNEARELAPSSAAAPRSSHLICLRNVTWQLAGAGPLEVFCVRFRAGALRHFIEPELAHVIDAPAPFEALAGPLGRELEACVAGAANFEAAVIAAERVLLALRRRFSRSDVLVDRAVRRLYAEQGRIRIASLAAELGVGTRHLARAFSKAEGIGPKQFARLVRLNKTVRALVLGRERHVGRSATAHGYVDQAHFGHEFRSLTSLAPSHFLATAARATHFYKPSLVR